MKGSQKHNIAQRQRCYGCGVCVNACPHGIISMEIDNDGFWRPAIKDEAKCTSCGLCLRICSYQNGNKEDRKPHSDTHEISPVGYSAISRDPETLMRSSSGGFAHVLALSCLERGFAAYCVRYDRDTKGAAYYRASHESLTEASGSKYLQAVAPADIDFSRNTLVFGTPCMIASLRNLVKLKKAENNFILVDFFCHGVPSMLMWQKYVSEATEAVGDVKDAKWRCKDHGWHDSWIMKITADKAERAIRYSQGDLFYRFYLHNRCLRPSCYDDCRFKMLSSCADIRIGDMWGRKYQNNQDGVSGVIVLTPKGREAIDLTRDRCTLTPESIEDVTESQMRKPANRPASYSYVTKALHSTQTLAAIDRRANLSEFWHDWLPGALRYYPKRLMQKVLEILKR